MLPQFVPVRSADAIVVLGNRPPKDEHGVVRPETQRRVEAGADAFRRKLAPRVVLSGGGSGELVEAEVMRAVALELGVPDDALWLESKSHSTVTNAKYSIALLRERLKKQQVSVIVVSSPYHLARAGRLFECTGAEVQLFPSLIPDSRSYRVGFTIYELWQRVLLLFIDECAQVRGERTNYRGVP